MPDPITLDINANRYNNKHLSKHLIDTQAQDWLGPGKVLWGTTGCLLRYAVIVPQWAAGR